MSPYLLTAIPALGTMAWALFVKFKDKKIFDFITLLVCGVAVVVNGLVVNSRILNGSASEVLHFIQILFSSAIVPLAYMYFSRQMGRKWNNATTIICWSLIAFTLIPNITIFLGESKVLTDPGLVRPFSINVVRNGALVFSCHTADMVILLQALMTVIRMIPAARTLKKYGLELSSRTRGFYVWWGGAVIFIVFTSFITIDDLRHAALGWFYYFYYTLLICGIYSLLALRFDLHPVVTAEEGEVVSVDEFIDANKQMAMKLRRMMEEDKIYLQPGYTSEDAVSALGTNRTYFSRMVGAEFGIKFSEMLNNARIDHAKNLLATTAMSVADVAFESGFSDTSYMSRKFHAAVGMTPHAYRESVRAALS